MVRRAPAACALAVLAVLAGGCGDDLQKARWFAASERMHLRAWTTASGYVYPFGWRDTVLDLACPLDAKACAPQVDAYFSDARCRDFVVASRDELPPIVMYVDGGAGKGHGFRIEEPFAGSVYAGWRHCVLVGPPEPGFHYATGRTYAEVQAADVQDTGLGWRYVYLAPAYAAVASDEAVAAAEAIDRVSVEDGPGRLRTRYLGTLADPSTAGVLDTHLDVPCAPAPDLAGAMRCLPRMLAPIYRDAFADAACTQAITGPLYAAPGYTRDAAGYARVDEPVGEVYIRAGSACAPASVAPWRATGRVDPAIFEPFTETELGPDD
jgi:hypothetical protein